MAFNASNINPRYLYASERRLLPAADFDVDDTLAQNKPSKPVAPAPVTAGPTVAPAALPNIPAPANPGPLMKMPGPALSDNRGPAVTQPDLELRDYRGRQIEDPMSFRRDQYVRQGGTTDEAGNLTPQKRSFMKKLGDAAMGAFLGLGQAHKANPNGGLGNLAAAIGAGVISGRDPVRARELRFNALERPQVEADENRQAQRQAKFLAAMKNQFEMEKLRADVEKSKADTERVRDLIRNPRQAQQPQLKLGRDRRTKDLRYFDPLDPAQSAQFEPYEFAQQRPRTPQLRLGRHVDTGEVDYYDAGDPDEATYYEPYQHPRAESGRTSRQRSGAAGQLNQINKLKREAAKAWDTWGKTTDPEKRRKAEAAAAFAQGTYNDAVRVLGETFPDDFETGGFTEANGNQGWAYYKPREGGQAQGNVAPQPTGQRKALVGADFVNHVANQLGVTPEEARRRIKEAGYEVR